MKVTGIAKFALYDAYPFAIGYEATVEAGEVTDAVETEVHEFSLDVYDNSTWEFAYYDAFNAAVDADVERQLIEEASGIPHALHASA